VSRRAHHRTNQARRNSAVKLSRIAAEYRDLADHLVVVGDLVRARRDDTVDLARELTWALDLARELDRIWHQMDCELVFDRDPALARALACDLALDLDLDREPDRPRLGSGTFAFDFDLVRARNRAGDLADHLRRLGVRLSPLETTTARQREVQTLKCLARVLPASVRSRFVAEALGDLGACDHWWQRMDHLVGLAIGTPRIAWMMRREVWRGREWQD